MQKITPCLWFDNQAEEAARFYCSLFKDSKILHVAHYGDTGPGPKGGVMIVRFQLQGQEFFALNGGPKFKFTEAISLMAHCETQADIDEYWEKLSAGGSTSVCGWLKDKYGLSWQVVPAMLGELMKDDGPKAARVMAAVMGMTKLDIAAMKRAHEEG
jgi:predicted 3-demethylubiquinone-9 3-methyltransferase (glyoxalase superfamily)